MNTGMPGTAPESALNFWHVLKLPEFGDRHGVKVEGFVDWQSGRAMDDVAKLRSLRMTQSGSRRGATAQSFHIVGH